MYLANHSNALATLTLKKQQLRLHNCQTTQSVVSYNFVKMQQFNAYNLLLQLPSTHQRRAYLANFISILLQRNHQLQPISKMSITLSTMTSRVSHLNSFHLLNFCFQLTASLHTKSYFCSNTSTPESIIPALLQISNPIIRRPFILQFSAAFHNDRVILNYSFIHVVSLTHSSHIIYNTQ